MSEQSLFGTFFQDMKLKKNYKILNYYNYHASKYCFLRGSNMDFQAGTVHVHHSYDLPKERLENWFSLHPADMDKVPLNIYPLLCI